MNIESLNEIMAKTCAIPNATIITSCYGNSCACGQAKVSDPASDADLGKESDDAKLPYDGLETHPYAIMSWLVVCAYYGSIPGLNIGQKTTIGAAMLSKERWNLNHQPRNLNKYSDRQLCALSLRIDTQEEIAGLVGRMIRTAEKAGWTPASGCAELVSFLSNTPKEVGKFRSLGGYVLHLLQTQRSGDVGWSEMWDNCLYRLGQLAFLESDSPPACLCCIYQDAVKIIAHNWDVITSLVKALGEGFGEDVYHKMVETTFNRGLKGRAT